MMLRCVSLALMAINFLWSIGAAIASYYAWSFYQDEVPENDLQPVWIALLVGLFSIAVVPAIFVANRVVKRRAIEAFEAAYGAFNEGYHRIDRRCQHVGYVLVQASMFFMVVTWFINSSKSTYDSFSMEGGDYKIFSVVAHSINTLASFAFNISIWFTYLDAEVVYIPSLANVPIQVRPRARVVLHANEVGHAGPNMDDVQRADPAGQQIELQELNPVEAPLQIQNDE